MRVQSREAEAILSIQIESVGESKAHDLGYIKGRISRIWKRWKMADFPVPWDPAKDEVLSSDPELSDAFI